MDKYTCIIVDDEKQAVDLLKDALNLLYKNVEIASVAHRWEEALGIIRSNSYDILFLDISMQDKNGMDLLKYVPGIDSEIIFVTAHSDFALEAFKYAAAGYLVKPFDDIELAAVVDKAIERIKNKKIASRGDRSSQSHKIGIPNNNMIEYVNVSDILYFEADKAYTKVITKEGTILSSYNLSKFNSLIAEHSFYQVHRSYIINLEHVRRYETSGTLFMDNAGQVPVSRNSRDGFLKLFNKVKGKETTG